MNLGAAAQQITSAISRYSEEQLRINEGRLARGIVRFSPPSITGPGFAERLRGLLPPEQTMPPVSRTLASRAAESLARQPVLSANGAGQGMTLDIVVSDAGIRNAADLTPVSAPAAQAEIPTAPIVSYASGASSAAALLGLTQRALGVAVDPGLATGFSFARYEPLSARPIGGQGAYLVRVAKDAYLKLGALPTL